MVWPVVVQLVADSPDEPAGRTRSEETMKPLFSPSVHTQRHRYVIDFVKTHTPKKVSNTGDDVEHLPSLGFCWR